MVCETCGKEFFGDWRKDKKMRKSEPRFCSRRCSNANNHKCEKRKHFCIQCNSEIIGSGKKYCSNRCQQLFEFGLKVKIWLETDVLGKHTGGKSGNCPEGKHLREYLLSEQKSKCAICGCTPVHNEQPLVFVLDHVDGISTNNARSNLRLICPNCDSQTLTFKGRNRGKGRRALGFSANKGL